MSSIYTKLMFLKNTYNYWSDFPNNGSPCLCSSLKRGLVNRFNKMLALNERFCLELQNNQSYRFISTPQKKLDTKPLQSFQYHDLQKGTWKGSAWFPTKRSTPSFFFTIMQFINRYMSSHFSNHEPRKENQKM